MASQAHFNDTYVLKKKISADHGDRPGPDRPVSVPVLVLVLRGLGPARPGPVPFPFRGVSARPGPARPASGRGGRRGGSRSLCCGGGRFALQTVFLYSPLPSPAAPSRWAQPLRAQPWLSSLGWLLALRPRHPPSGVTPAQVQGTRCSEGDAQHQQGTPRPHSYLHNFSPYTSMCPCCVTGLPWIPSAVQSTGMKPWTAFPLGFAENTQGKSMTQNLRGIQTLCLTVFSAEAGVK
uniref:uncharacterized protein LOC129124770 n=1 Tax=Agelaius phoeniceus TaxID=39638 RepID=UPI0023ED77B6|nr:uncharacterized protein LOC129124770 [Agelaius phoeniceus]